MFFAAYLDSTDNFKNGESTLVVAFRIVAGRSNSGVIACYPTLPRMLTRFFAVTLLSFWSQATLADSEKIVEIAESECGVCHGEKGVSEKPLIPSIGGFSESAILDLLTTYENDFRKARRVTLDDGTETDMIEVIEAFSQSELEAFALYYSQQTWMPIEQAYDREVAAEGAKLHKVKCNKCHINGGSVPESDHALMAGQWRDYLKGEFKNFDDGSRRMSSKMQQKYETLNAEGKQAIIEFYVSAGDF
ncbi:MAG: hypothetical protein OXG15_06460 [Gammaproteobacteria bacterium]|nr:hypothetical protein [Gammaproteobacteria bacterium]